MPADYERTRPPAISAHRGGSEGAPPGTYQAYREALSAGADYVEIDVRRAADGALVVSHPARLGPFRRRLDRLGYDRLCAVAGYEVPRVAEVLPLLAGRAGLHLDVQDAGSAVAAAELALDHLQPADIIATTRDPQVARELGHRFPVLGVGVTVGGDAAETVRFAARRALRPGPAGSGPSRLDPVTAAGASWAALHHRQAEALARQCRERGIRTLVWTVSSDRALGHWLGCPAVDVLVTDRPGRAVALRNSASPAAWPGHAARPDRPGGPPGSAPGPAR